MDKTRSLFPIPITFTSGEIPTPEKLSAIGTQARRGLNIVEYILGDTWNQSGDAFLQYAGTTAYALMIPNIARYLGKTNNMNPRVPYLTEITSYNHLVAISDIGKREATLSLPPTVLTSFTWAGTSAPSGSPQTSVGNVNASGRWYVDRTTGWCYFYDAIQSDWNVTYIPQVEGDLGEEATWNVIPDINRNTSYEFGGCKIAYKNGSNNSEGYMIYLPPRGPLGSDKLIDRSPQSQYDISGNAANESLTPDSLPVKFWQSDDVAATVGSYAEHYRYSLPKLITDNYSNGATLPGGMLYLWDHSQTGTILEGLTFTAEDVESPRSYVLIASGTALDSWVTNYFSTAYPSANLTHVGDTSSYHTSVYYPSAGLKLITIGSDITATLSNLIKMFYNHDHGSANSLPGNVVSHTKLSETFSPIVSQASLSRRLPVSTWGYDDHPQYIHRLGYDNSNLSNRDVSRGGMLGDLLMCSSSSTNNYLNLSADSRKIRFGLTSSGTIEPCIYYCYWDDDEDMMDSIHIRYKKVTMGDSYGSAIEFRDIESNIATSARIHHTAASEPIVSIERADKTEGEGEGAALQVNRIYSGSYYDSVYGYSGDSDAGWGPVRTYTIDPIEWQLFQLEHSSSGELTPVTPVIYSVGEAPHIGTYMAMLGSGVGFSMTAFHTIKLPFKSYAIVGGSLNVKAISADIPYTDIYSYWYKNTNSPYSSTYSFNKYLWPSGDLTTSWRECNLGKTTITKTSSDILVEKDDYKTIGIAFRLFGTFIGNPLYIHNVNLLYRIKEF